MKLSWWLTEVILPKSWTTILFSTVLLPQSPNYTSLTHHVTCCHIYPVTPDYISPCLYTGKRRESHVSLSDRRWSFLYILFRFSTFPITKVFPSDYKRLVASIPSVTWNTNTSHCDGTMYQWTRAWGCFRKGCVNQGNGHSKRKRLC